MFTDGTREKSRKTYSPTCHKIKIRRLNIKYSNKIHLLEPSLSILVSMALIQSRLLKYASKQIFKISTN